MPKEEVEENIPQASIQVSIRVSTNGYLWLPATLALLYGLAYTRKQEKRNGVDSAQMMTQGSKNYPNDRLRHAREERGWTQLEVADAIGVSKLAVGRWERGERSPQRFHRKNLCELFGLTAIALGLLPEPITTHSDPEVPQPQPAIHWNVPYARNPFFTGRDALLQDLHQRFSQAQTTTTSHQAYALSGLGGLGKTQIAIEYAYRHTHDYTAVFWISAETAESSVSSLVSIAEQLHLPEYEEEHQQQMIQAVLQWLTLHNKWLLIFDNIEEISLLTPFQPIIRHGSILITTCLHSLSGLAHIIEIAPMTSQEGIPFLLRRTRLFDPTSSQENIPSQLLEPAQTLVEAMGGLPLALDQAGAYIERTGCTLLDYQLLYQSHQIPLLNERSQMLAHPDSVVKTFLFSFANVTATNPATADLLRICAFLAPDPIPEDLFTQNTSSLGPILAPVASDPLLLNQALGDAFHYSLLQRQPQNHTFSLHHLVQIVLLAMMDEATRRQWATRILEIIANHLSKIQEEHIWSNDHRYLPHAQHVIRHVILQEPDQKEQALLASIWYYIGLVAEQQSQLTEAKDAYQHGLVIAQPLHLPLETRLLAHTGYVISDLGDDQQAVQYLKQAVLLAQDLHDEKTLCFALLHQGQIQDNMGNYQHAKTIYQQGLSVALHLNDWAMASAFLQDLGVQVERRGEYPQAALFYQEGLSYAQQSTQPARQSALLMNLGMLAIRQQRYEQALTFTLESLHFAQQIRNRYRMSAVSQNLGIIYRHLGQLTQAQLYLKQSLQLAQEIQHRWLIAETQGEYGWLLLQQEKAHEAQEAFQMMQSEAQAIQAPQLIAHALFGLAHVAAQQNYRKQARALAQESLDLFTQLEDAQRHSIAQWLENLRDISE